MRNKLLKKITGITCIAAALCIMRVCAFAADSGTYGDITWSIDGRTLTISGTGVVTYDLVVDELRHSYSYSSVVKLIVEDGITEIAEDTFRTSSLENVELAGSVKTIGEYAFYNSRGLYKVSMPGVTSIGESAFQGTELDEDYAPLPDGLEVIGEKAFYNTDYFDFNLPASVTYIGEQALRSKYVENITVSEENPYYCTVNSVLFNKDKTNLIYYPANYHQRPFEYDDDDNRIEYEPDTYDIPDTVTDISDYAFFGVKYLGTVNISANVKNIGIRAFYSTIKLINIAQENDHLVMENNLLLDAAKTTVYFYLTPDDAPAVLSLPETIEVIPDYVFTSHEEITELILPKSLKSIGLSAFMSCSNLEKITLWADIESIGFAAFNFCESLSSIVFYGTETDWNDLYERVADRNDYFLNSEITYMGAVSDEPYFSSLVFQRDSNIMGWHVGFFTGDADTNATALVALYNDDGLLAVKQITLEPHKTMSVFFSYDDYMLGEYKVGYAKVFCWETLNGLKPVWETPLEGEAY